MRVTPMTSPRFGCGGFGVRLAARSHSAEQVLLEALAALVRPQRRIAEVAIGRRNPAVLHHVVERAERDRRVGDAAHCALAVESHARTSRDTGTSGQWAIIFVASRAAVPRRPKLFAALASLRNDLAQRILLHELEAPRIELKQIV